MAAGAAWIVAVGADKGNAHAAIVVAVDVTTNHARPTVATLIDVAVPVHQVIVANVPPRALHRMVIVDGSHPLSRLLRTAGSDIYIYIRLSTYETTILYKLIRAKPMSLFDPPSQVIGDEAVILRTNPILPVIAIDITAARPPQNGCTYPL